MLESLRCQRPPLPPRAPGSQALSLRCRRCPHRRQAVHLSRSRRNAARNSGSRRQTRGTRRCPPLRSVRVLAPCPRPWRRVIQSIRAAKVDAVGEDTVYIEEKKLDSPGARGGRGGLWHRRDSSIEPHTYLRPGMRWEQKTAPVVFGGSRQERRMEPGVEARDFTPSVYLMWMVLPSASIVPLKRTCLPS